MRTAYLVVGAIGSGKSALADFLLSRPPLDTLEYVGSDVYKQRFFPTIGHDYKRGYRCADELAFHRLEQLCIAAKDFLFELCPTNPNKMQTLRQLLSKYHYSVVSFFVATERSDINIERCKNRQGGGGDPITAEKIRSRYALALNRALEIIDLSVRIYFVDNSGGAPTLVAVIIGNKISVLNDACGWFKTHIQNRVIPTSVVRREQ
jgi:predicted ABC-type ATPase